ncbi:Lrp/AsnC family transcriptional regulator [Roseicitreum antarcticum]|uniref:DNA-binding transcriptional regulator, Lrp family n=1 Tax=Roseicitreum antarcticum TaxID=564137 RepID=A0A1H2TL50_9RHOB|nr:Lrp/AsnC family transcriptional regulator [Roseicitreum antarcticum]SDW44631.1 DNA-binding transcriptional regulator, Lrp family [Roseicitreum antarcticum]
MKTNGIRQGRPRPAELDRTDRILLRLLAESADRSYAELSELVHLSPPAVHERVRRLRRDGVIQGTVAKLNGEKIGCPLLAFIHVTTEGWGMTKPVLALKDLADVEEIHTVTGDACLILKVRSASPSSLETLLSRIQEIQGVRATQSYVALGTYLERGPMPEAPEPL